MSRRVEIIGGGPGGLYAARLLKRADPALQVVVHERLAGGEQTFGFGVGLTASTLRNLEAADSETAAQVREASYAGHTLELRGADRAVTLHGARNLAIGRATLLGILADAAKAAGVEYRPGSAPDPRDVSADVVIAADGVRSTTRRWLAAELGVRTKLGRTRFVWCGADFAADAAFFSSVSTEKGLFVAHAYPYADDRSTCLIEVDEETWRTSGLDSFDAHTPAGTTDHASVELLQRVFTRELRGRPLLTNRTRWAQFTNLCLDRWSSGNTVLLGDAAHTAHYTLGSGTKLALEDAIALATALTGEESVASAFATYESTRRPAVERFQRLAARSQGWWDSFRMRAGWDLEHLALSYMTRSGNLTLTDYAREHADVARAALGWLGPHVPTDPDQLDDWVLAQPLRDPDLGLPRRCLSREGLHSATAVVDLHWAAPDVWDEAADDVVARAAAWPQVPVLLHGPDEPEAIGARIDMAERIRLQAGRAVGVALPRAATVDGAAAVGTGRADFIVTGRGVDFSTCMTNNRHSRQTLEPVWPCPGWD
jgi:anthraniloyl-CoA monooxygenase